MRKSIIIVFISCFSAVLYAQTVTNVVAKRVGTTVEITYDIDKPANVELSCWDDGSCGESFFGWNLSKDVVKGDIGYVTAGHKKAIWDMLGGYGTHDINEPCARFRLLVERKPQDKLTFSVNGTTFSMILVKRGKFTMGGTPEQGTTAQDEYPLREDWINAFYIGQTEVTQGLWYAVMGVTQREQWQRVAPKLPYKGEGYNHPMYYISWNECQVFAKKLTELLKSQIPGMKFTLPTEAQWEYAARGGHMSGSHRYRYSGSDNVGSVAWYGENSGNTTHPVATKSPNQLGIYDMSGNLWEWVQDWYGTYQKPLYLNEDGPDTGKYKVYRGGCWVGDECRVARRRGDFVPGAVSCGLGCRIALVPIKKTDLDDFFRQEAFSNTIAIRAYKVQKFSTYAKPIVEKAINEWQRKDEFEKIADYQKRVNETSRNAKIKELTMQCEKDYIAKYRYIKPDVTIDNQYDAENEVFLLSDAQFGNMLVPVPISEARAFKQNWSSAQFKPKYFIENDVLALASLDIYIPALQKHYMYSNQASLKYEQAQVDYNFNPIEIAANGITQKGQQTIEQKKITIGKSSVDLNIPETNVSNKNTFVVIIANENYKSVASVPYALNDGRILAKYCQRTLGIPATNIKLFENATYNDMRLAVAWLKNVCEKYEGEASVIFYYAGHGIPDDSDKSSYLLPVDGDGRYVSTGYKLDELYQKLGAMPTKSTTILLDACFAGINRDGEALTSARSVALKVRKGVPQGNSVVLSAAQGDETAGFNEEEGHGMFTYYVLKKLQETKGDVTLQNLSQYVIREVGRKSAVTDKPQTPCVTPSATLGPEWQNWKLK